MGKVGLELKGFSGSLFLSLHPGESSSISGGLDSCLPFFSILSLETHTCLGTCPGFEIQVHHPTPPFRPVFRVGVEVGAHRPIGLGEGEFCQDLKCVWKSV